MKPLYGVGCQGGPHDRMPSAYCNPLILNDIYELPATATGACGGRSQPVTLTPEGFTWP